MSTIQEYIGGDTHVCNWWPVKKRTTWKVNTSLSLSNSYKMQLSSDKMSTIEIHIRRPINPYVYLQTSATNSSFITKIHPLDLIYQVLCSPEFKFFMPLIWSLKELKKIHKKNWKRKINDIPCNRWSQNQTLHH